MFQNRAVLSIVLVVTIALMADKAAAATYYMSPTGSDSNPGSTSSPWRTFSFALARLGPGDNLLLKDGTYSLSTTGMIAINCAVHSNGTSGNPITVRAENERRVFLNGNGMMRPISVMNCSYWNISGIYARSSDAAAGGIGGLVGIYYSNHITIRRMLLTHPNGCVNDHVISLFGGSNNLVEENELYDFHRHGISLEGGEIFSTVRRNYSNSRGNTDLPCIPFPSLPSYRGDAAYIAYPGSYNILENNISEGQGVGYAVEAISGSDSNAFYGNISLHDVVGFSAVAREPGGSDYYMPRNSLIRDLLVVDASSVGVSLRSNKNTRLQNASIFGAGGVGVVADMAGSPNNGDGSPSVFITNTIASRASYSFYVMNQAAFSCDYCSGDPIYNSGIPYFPGGTQLTAPPANLGTCLAWIPKSSNLSGAGAGGADIGATIFYRYENGVLTSTPLWDMNTGEFPHGAIVSGVNDIGGASAFDVHTRLNINTNGCGFPSGSSTTPSRNESSSATVSSEPSASSTSVLTAPTGLFGQCNSDGTFTVGWDALPGADSYYLRVDYGANNSGDDWYVVPGEDFYLDEYHAVTFSAPVIADHTYSWWVHGANSTAGIGPATSGTINCSRQ